MPSLLKQNIGFFTVNAVSKTSYTPVAYLGERE